MSLVISSGQWRRRLGRLSRQGQVLYLVAVCWTAENRKDRFIPADAVWHLFDLGALPRRERRQLKLIDELIEHGLWGAVRGGLELVPPIGHRQQENP